MRLNFERMTSRAKFGTVQTIPTDTLEGSKEVFVPQRTLYFAFYQRTQKQEYELLGTKLEDSIVIAVRSQCHVDNSLLVKIPNDDAIYKVVAITRGNPRVPSEFDLITLLSTEKVGDGNA